MSSSHQTTSSSGVFGPTGQWPSSSVRTLATTLSEGLKSRQVKTAPKSLGWCYQPDSAIRVVPRATWLIYLVGKSGLLDSSSKGPERGSGVCTTTLTIFFSMRTPGPEVLQPGSSSWQTTMRSKRRSGRLMTLSVARGMWHAPGVAHI